MSKLTETVTAFTLKLSRPLHLADGKTVEELKVREPEVRDYRIAGQQGKSSIDNELIVTARCCGLVVEDLDRLTFKDYKKLQTFLFGEEDSNRDAE